MKLFRSRYASVCIYPCFINEAGHLEDDKDAPQHEVDKGCILAWTGASGHFEPQGRWPYYQVYTPTGFLGWVLASNLDEVSQCS